MMQGSAILRSSVNGNCRRAMPVTTGISSQDLLSLPSSRYHHYFHTNSNKNLDTTAKNLNINDVNRNYHHGDVQIYQQTGHSKNNNMLFPTLQIMQPSLPSLSNVHHYQIASFSSSSSSSSSNNNQGIISGWMESRKQRKEQEQYLEQMERLSSMDILTLEGYHAELKRNISGITSNISFLQSKETKLANEVVKTIEAFMSVLGKDIPAKELANVTRIQKLQISQAANKTVEEISIMIAQIQNMDLMQRTLRKRRLEGKPIPKDQQHMQNVIKNDAKSVLTKKQKAIMKQRQRAAASRMARRR